MKAWILLFLSISGEIVATSALKASQGLSRLAPSVLVVVGYLTSFYLFSISLKTLPLGLAYAIAAGAGTVGTVLAGVFLWKEAIDIRHVIAIGLIVAGIVILKAIAPRTE